MLEIQALIRILNRKGITTEDEILEEVKQLRDEMEVKIKENGFWLGALKNSYQYGYDPDEILNYQLKIDQITKEDIKSVAKKYLNFEESILIRHFPEK